LQISASIDAGLGAAGSVGARVPCEAGEPDRQHELIHPLRKLANDERLSGRGWAVLADDVSRPKDFQDRHNRR
jgi:hypothetical protein